ncbi:MAG TPA: neutral zinc metallopeptidase [Aestuariivirga sp.]|nr:neutral zinc metallopeptidase [Aestuariivirga sp.]HRA94239.1 neutral zinc metallopeptidase [Aestuariivirga sp.]
MRLENEKPSENVEDRRGQGGGMGRGFGFPRGGSGRGINIPMGGGRGGFSISTLVMLVIVYFAVKFIFGIDLLQVLNGGGVQVPGGGTSTEMTIPRGNTDVADGDVQGGATTTSTDVTGDAGKDFVARVLGSTERVWGGVFRQMGQTYQTPTLVLFTGFVQSACGSAQSQMGPFYCPRDSKVYIDLAFYQDMKNKLGADGDAAQGYVIAHEVGHHLQNIFGIADKVTQARMRASAEEGNVLSVRMELQADCFAGIWAKESNVFEDGDIEEALNAANAIGDDRLQKKSQGYAVPDSFTHGTSEQRVRWFKTGFQATDLGQCDTFATDQL